MAFIGGVVMGMLCDVQQRLFSSIYDVYQLLMVPLAAELIMLLSHKDPTSRNGSHEASFESREGLSSLKRPKQPRLTRNV